MVSPCFEATKGQLNNDIQKYSTDLVTVSSRHSRHSTHHNWTSIIFSVIIVDCRFVALGLPQTFAHSLYSPIKICILLNSLCLDLVAEH